MRIIDILPFFSWLERWCIGNEHGILGPLGPLTRSAAVACGACKSSAFETRISSEFFLMFVDPENPFASLILDYLGP